MSTVSLLRDRMLRPIAWAVLVAVAGLAGPAFAVHNASVFELDGNATTQSPQPGAIDWDAVYANFLSGGVPGQSFLTDITGQGDSILTGGHTKDIYDVSVWQSAQTGSTSAPDKDDIAHAYAALFTLGNGDEVIYFGADRYSNSGNSDIGFWFFKQPVKAPAGGNGNFVGSHSDGDVLVVSDFLNGGSASVIEVFKWVGNGTSGHLEQISAGAGSVVDPVSGLFCLNNDYACAVANKTSVAAPWPYTFKGSAPPATFPQGTLFEGGVNITQLLGGSECFASFMAESRSSATANSTLQDYVIGPFRSCSIKVDKTCAVTGIAPPGSPGIYTATYTASVTNTGDGSLPAGTVITLNDVPNSGTTDTQTATLSAPLASKATFNFPNPTGTFYTNLNPPLNTITATATFGTNTLTDTLADVRCSSISLNEAVTITKNCGWVSPARPGIELILQNGVLVTRVNVSGTVCNSSTTSGSGSVPLDIVVRDYAAGDPASVASGDPAGNVIFQQAGLAEGACVDYAYSYLPNAADGSTSPASVGAFSDTATVKGTNAALFGGQAALNTASTTCKVCPCNGLNCP